MEGAITRAEYLPLTAPGFGEEDIAEVAEAMRSGWVTTGPRVATLQRRLGEYLGAEHVRCLASCTAGISLALRLAGVGPGDEVLVPTMTFVSCANAVEHAGARPVFVDCDPATGLLDLDAAGALAGPATAALIVVHLGGRPADVDAVNAFRDRHGITVIEDAAHAIGAEWQGRRIGTFGNPAAFSFHATKNMTTFEGGALTVRTEEEAERVRRLSLHGLSHSSWSRHGTADPAGYDVLEPGFKCAMHDVSAAVGLHQLGRLDESIARRHELAGAYDERLAELALDLEPPVAGHARHAHHLYAVAVRGDAPTSRNDLIAGLHAARIGTSVHFNPIHRYTYYRERYGLRASAFPAAEARADRMVSLPLFPRMHTGDVDDVAAALARLLS
jgi:dTDP-4-amino-4,6-dideoxygalactose transaminase